MGCEFLRHERLVPVFWQVVAICGFLGLEIYAGVEPGGFRYENQSGRMIVTGYGGTNTVVAIPSVIEGLPVTEIAPMAFVRSRLISIALPESLEKIGDSAFLECPELEAVTADGNNSRFSSVDGVLFNKNQTTLIVFPEGKGGSYEIPETVTRLEPWAFSHAKLTSIRIPSGVASISEWAFAYCRSLTNVVMANGVFSIGALAFYECASLRDATLSETLVGIGEGAFAGCRSLASIPLPGGVASIGAAAFSSCTSLTNFVIPNGVTTIREGTFDYCTNLVSVTIPNSVRIIEQYPFSDCISLRSIVIPEGVTSLGSAVFEHCAGLTNVTLPNSVSSIGDALFYHCANLSRITLPTNLGAITSSLFEGCTSLAQVEIPAGVTNIGRRAFAGCADLTNVAFVDGVMAIEDRAFADCASLPHIELPASVQNISDFTFPGCTNLTAITVAPKSERFSSLDGVLFDKEGKMLLVFPEGKGGSYAIPDGVTGIGKYGFLNCDRLLEVIMPYGLTNIGRGAFGHCDNLAAVTIPNSVTFIDDQAFAYCRSLTEVMIPASVTWLGHHAFLSCTGLTKLSIRNREGWGWMQNNPFDGCTSISGIYFYQDAPEVDPWNLFSHAAASTIYYLPDASGWGPTFGGRPTAQWLPRAGAPEVGFGPQGNQLRFDIYWAEGKTVVVEVCADLKVGSWEAVETLTLMDGSVHFTEEGVGQDLRIYRVREL